VSDQLRPPLRRVHADETLSTGESRFSLEYWRRCKTEEIVNSLRPGKPEALQVKADGRILNGNVRVKVLEERGFDVNSLEREVI
jgi:hypothetical protein